MDVLFISGRTIYSEINSSTRFEELPLFQDKNLANKLKKFSKEGNAIIFIDIWATYKNHNKEIAEFFGPENERGEILFYCPGYITKKLIDKDKEVLQHKKYLEGVSIGTNACDSNLLFERIVQYFYKKGQKIDNVFLELGTYDYYPPVEQYIRSTLVEKVKEYNENSNNFIGEYQTCIRKPVKILFTDKDDTLFGRSVPIEQQDKNIQMIDSFTKKGNIIVILTKGHGANCWDDFQPGYSNSNLYGMVLSQMASVCINETNDFLLNYEYPSIPVAINRESDKKEAVKLFLDYFTERGYTFDGIYAIGDSKADFGMIEYVNSINGEASLIGRDVSSFSDFIKKIETTKQKKLKYTYTKYSK